MRPWAKAGFVLIFMALLAAQAGTGFMRQLFEGAVYPRALRAIDWILQTIFVGPLGAPGATIVLLLLGMAGAVMTFRRATRNGASGMTGRAWMSSLLSNQSIGNKQGLRTKYHGHDWTPAEFRIPLAPDDVHANMRRASQGFALQRNELPEAAAVWNEQRFKTVGQIFYVGGFLTVRGKLADVLSRFDLSENGLVPLPIYRADLVTAHPGEFFLLNFGCRKNTLLPERSDKVAKFAVEKTTGFQIWQVNDWEEGEVALSREALSGPDLWAEEALYNKIFLSDALAQAIVDIGMGPTFRLEECRIVGA